MSKKSKARWSHKMVMRKWLLQIHKRTTGHLVLTSGISEERLAEFKEIWDKQVEPHLGPWQTVKLLRRQS